VQARARIVLLALVFAASYGCDRLTKSLAISQLKPTPPSSFLNDSFRLQYTENPGSFLSLGAGLPEGVRGWLLIGALGCFLLGLLAFVAFSGQLRLPAVVGCALILGGGLGNWTDRVLYGNVVVDFMNVGLGPVRSGVFNVADLWIEAGAVLLLVGALRGRKREPRAGIAEDRRANGP